MLPFGHSALRETQDSGKFAMYVRLRGVCLYISEASGVLSREVQGMLGLSGSVVTVPHTARFELQKSVSGT